MAELTMLREVAVIAAVGVVVTVVLGRFRLPTVAGLLFSGALVGPHGLRLVSDVHALELIAEVGVVLLLFTIGLEFSIERLRNILERVALGGLLQVGATVGAVVLVGHFVGLDPRQGVFFGFALALSSTAIVLRGLAERRELDAPHGRFLVGTLIFQDLCVVPMVLIVPVLAHGGELWGPIALALLKAAGLVSIVLVVSKAVVPRLLRAVDANRSREVFLLAVLSLCIGTAWLSSLAGLSLALGAFLGGMVVAGTEYSHRAMGEMLPLRDVFVSFFFVSLGTFFNVHVVARDPVLVVAILAGLVLAKGFLASMAALIMRFPPRAAWLAGVGLAQFGEFGFVILRLGIHKNLVTAAAVSPVLCAGIISMFLTPLLIYRAPHVTAGEKLLGPLAKLLKVQSIEEVDTSGAKHRDHVIIIGYGLAGRMVARSLAQVGLDHIVLELNADNVRQARSRREPVYYADATSAEALTHSHVQTARAVAIVINDPQAAYRVIATVRRLNPTVPIFLRTHYLAEGKALREVGATDIVAEEVEGGAEVLNRLLRRLDIPEDVVHAQMQNAYSDIQELEKTLNPPSNS
jgi:CPA2 family monovalent cation:H+ antiporter-2